MSLDEGMEDGWFSRKGIECLIFDDVFREFKSEKNATVNKAFTRDQKRVLIDLFDKAMEILDWHCDKEEQPHEGTLGESIGKLDAKLRNHRHDTRKTYSGKPEF